MEKDKFFECVQSALENWDFDYPGGETVRAGLEKILNDKVDLSANVRDDNHRWEDIEFQARYVMFAA
jgi:hypothetical protein